MHGFSGSTAAFEDAVPILSSEDIMAVAIDRVGFGLTERPESPALPSLPPLPGRDQLADLIESTGTKSNDDEPRGLATLVPSVPSVIATGLRRPSTLSFRRPWKGVSPYSSEFAVSAIWPLLKELKLEGSEIFFVGHSAGSPIALRCYVEASSKQLLPERAKLGGCYVVAPAVLELGEDPDAYNQSEEDGSQIPLPLRLAAFRTLLALPDAFSVKVARRLVDNRDVREALLGQTHPRMAEPDMEERVQQLAEKYLAPTKQFDDWDIALLNVYRADVGTNDILKGRSLLAKARSFKRTGSRLGVLTGDSDNVVPIRASRRVAELLEVPLEQIPECGHLPMDEKPSDFAARLIHFVKGDDLQK